MKSFYSDYINHISDILDKKPTMRTFSVDEGLEKAVVNCRTIRQAKESTSLPTVKNQLPMLFGVPSGYRSMPTIGTHPNFSDMKLGTSVINIVFPCSLTSKVLPTFPSIITWSKCA